jgi:hypothetical protein
MLDENLKYGEIYSPHERGLYLKCLPARTLAFENRKCSIMGLKNALQLLVVQMHLKITSSNLQCMI